MDFTWTAEEIRRVGYRVADLVAEHLSNLPDEPVFRPLPPDRLARAQSSALPERGQPVDALLDEFAREIAPYPFGNGHPRFYGWVNSPPAVVGVFGAALAAAMNPSVAGGNHGAVALEHEVVGWFRRLLGFPEGSAGLLVSGTSTAALISLAAARHRACGRVGWDVRASGLQGRGDSPRLTVYLGSEAHGCHQKAVELLGLGSASIRHVPGDERLRLRADALDTMLAEDLADGRLPVAVVASAGSVNTGAIDPLDALADVCARHDVWLHVDGAYGGPAVMLEELRPELAPMARADSVALDPHKWLYVPVDAGLVLVKDAAGLRDAFSLVPPYLRTDGDEHGVQGPPWFSEFGTEQTRPFRALKVWLALRYFGLEGYRELLAHDMALARRLAAGVRQAPALVLWEPQGLSIVCFRAAPPALGDDGEALDRLNRAVLSRVQLGGEAFLSSTVMGGRFWLRACVVNPRATESDVDRLLAVVQAAVAAELAPGA